VDREEALRRKREKTRLRRLDPEVRERDRLKSQRYRALNPERVADLARRHAEREKVRAAARTALRRAARAAWVEANPDWRRSYSQAWKKAHPERVLELAKRWRIKQLETNPDSWRARERSRFHQRRAKEKSGTLTGRDVERILNARTMCPLCGRKMLVGPRGHPRQKTIDHIVPLNQGGTHSHGNVRAICWECNNRRPRDGRDYEGQLGLAV
jgi:5-methylcytosine-specific restriction endonuclease McrA